MHIFSMFALAYMANMAYMAYVASAEVHFYFVVVTVLFPPLFCHSDLGHFAADHKSLALDVASGEWFQVPPRPFEDSASSQCVSGPPDHRDLIGPEPSCPAEYSSKGLICSNSQSNLLPYNNSAYNFVCFTLNRKIFAPAMYVFT